MIEKWWKNEEGEVRGYEFTIPNISQDQKVELYNLLTNKVLDGKTEIEVTYNPLNAKDILNNEGICTGFVEWQVKDWKKVRTKLN